MSTPSSSTRSSPRKRPPAQQPPAVSAHGTPSGKDSREKESGKEGSTQSRKEKDGKDSQSQSKEAADGQALTNPQTTPRRSRQTERSNTRAKAEEIKCRLLGQIRELRDRRETSLKRRFGEPTPDRAEGVEPVTKKPSTLQGREEIPASLEDLNNFVEKLEREKTGGKVFEELISDPKYKTAIFQQPIIKSTQSGDKKAPTASPRKTFDPIAVKVEEGTSAAAANASSATSHSLLIENNCQRELKQENQIMSRIAELRRQGLWSSSRLPLCVEPPRSKTHWDFLLEEMKWMATDFRQERNLKKAVARRLSWTIARLKKEEELEVERAEQRAIKEGKRIAGAIAKMVDEFWRNVDKVVEYRAQEIIKSRKRRAQAQHLEFIVGEATKLSSLVHEGLVAERTSKTPSIASKDDLENDAEFGFSGSESDDESTIAQAEKAMKEEDVSSELKSLEKEAGQDLDDLFASLPPEYLESLGIKLPQTDTAPSTSKIAEEEEESGPSTRKRRGSTSRDTVVKQKSSGGKETAISAEERPVDSIMDVDETTKDSTLTQGTGTEASTSPEGVEKGDSQARHPEAEGNGDGRGVLENVNYDKLQSENSEDRQRELSNIAEEALKFQPKGYTLDTTQVKTQVPFLVRGQLREYQMVGLDWLVTLYENNLNGILADEMGLGKTIQTIALLAHLACSERIWGPHLIVVPTSVILNWEMELKKWCPALKILTYFGGQKERQEKRKGWNRPHQFHVCITSYKTVTTDIRSFKMKAWQYLILDEAQNIKNWKSQRWQALLNVRARRRLLLTGTPLQNSLMELWSLLHFLMPAVFGSHDDFKDWFSNPLTGMMDGSVEYNQALVDRLHKVLRPFILRRLKCEVEKQLPEKTEKVIKCSLSKRQRYLYDDFMSRRSTKENLKTGNMMSVLNIVMQLRKCCNHPNLFEPRPVVAPFILTPRHMAYPAMLMDLCREDEDVRDDKKKQIPQGLIIANRFTGWAMNTPARHSAPLIEELEQWAEEKRPPKVDGFRFQRPPWDKKQLPPSASSSQAPAVVNISSAELERAGFGENEMFLVVKEGDDLESLLSNSEGAPVPMRVRVENGRVVLDTEQVQPQQIGKTRLCQEVTGQNGEKTLREVSPSRAPAAAIPPQSSKAVTATISHDNCPPSDGIPAATLLGTGVGPSTSHQEIPSYPQIVTYKSLMQQGRQPLVAHPSLRSQVVRHDDQPSRQPNTPSGGFHDTMTNGGTRDSINNPNYKFSPPLKKRKRDTSPLVKGEYADYVPDYVLRNFTEEMKKRLELAAARFATSTQTTPIFSNQLIDALQHEFRVVKRRPPNIFNRDIFAAAETHEDIRERLAENVEWITRKFPLFIDAAQCDAVHFSSTSSGRLACRRLEDTQAELTTRQVLEGENKLTDAVLLARKLQFPELRLIEYDCGKLQILANLLRELYLYKHRVLIFTQMSRMLDVLQAFLSYHGYQYFRLDGTTGVEQRQAMMERFNADPKVFCFILSTRSGGIGVNLTGADTVVFYDSDWNPTMDAQAQDRCHRIGQTRNVTIYRLISERTIEENILKKAMQKRRLGEMAIDEAGFTPDFFKKTDNIRDLFDGEQAVADIVREVNEQDAPRDQSELEKAMASLEDEQDVAAAKIAAAEARADRAEFEEAAKTGTAVSLLGSVDEQADEKYLELINQLKPIERYAINVLETEYKPEFEEELREAEIAIDAQKEEWQRSHERAMDSIEGEEDGDMSSKVGGRKSARATQDGGNLEDDFYIGGNLIDEVRSKSSHKKSSPNSGALKNASQPLRVSSRRAMLDAISAANSASSSQSSKTTPTSSKATPSQKSQTHSSTVSSQRAQLKASQNSAKLKVSHSSFSHNTPSSHHPHKPASKPAAVASQMPSKKKAASEAGKILSPPRSSFGRTIRATARLRDDSPPPGIAGLLQRLHSTRSNSSAQLSPTTPTSPRPSSGVLQLNSSISSRRSVHFANANTPSSTSNASQHTTTTPISASPVKRGPGRPPKPTSILRKTPSSTST